MRNAFSFTPRGWPAIGLAGLLIASTMGNAAAQKKYTPWTNPSAPKQSENTVLGLVDELNKLIGEAKKSRAADPRFLRDLQDLVGRYDNPWRVAVVSDDFADGDFTKNPAWTVSEGRFWIERGYGLRGTFKPKAQAKPKPQQRERSGDVATQLFGAILNQALGGKSGNTGAPAVAQPEPAAGPASIHLARSVSNGFAIELEISSWSTEGILQLGLYRGRDRAGGYRLRYRSGTKPELALLSVSARGSGQLANRTLSESLEDKKRHVLKWTRDRFGQMVVRIDGKEVLRATDRGAASNFDGFSLVNQGGDYIISRIAIQGTG